MQIDVQHISAYGLMYEEKTQLYKQLKILVNANFIRPIAGYPGMYFINTNYFYNGALDRQLDLPVNDDVEVIGCDFTKEKDSSHFWLVDTSTLDGKPDEEDEHDREL